MLLLLLALTAHAQEDPPADPPEGPASPVRDAEAPAPEQPAPTTTLQDSAAPELIPGAEPPPSEPIDAPPPPFDLGFVWYPVSFFQPMLVSEQEAIDRNDPSYIPVVEFGLEASLAPHHALQVTVGLGWRTFGEDRWRRTQIGGRYRAYFLRPFDGLFGGLQLKRYDIANQQSTLVWTTVSAVAGYKHIIPVGLTVEAVGDIGVRWGTNQDTQLDWNVGLALGWSFRIRSSK